MSFHSKYNYDDIFNRTVIVGLLRLFNDIRIKYQYSDLNFEMKKIPFYYSSTGQERYMQDFFLNQSLDCETHVAEGNIDPIPRGVFKLNSTRISKESLLNKYVRATYQREDSNGQLKSYSAMVNMVPIELNFSMEVNASVLGELYKIQEKFWSLFYRARKFNTTYYGFRIPCQAGFSEDAEIEKLFEFTFDDKKFPLLKFEVIVEAYYPVIDETTELFRGNVMKAIDLNLSLTNAPTINLGEQVLSNHDIPTGTIAVGWDPIIDLNQISRLQWWLNSSGIQIFPDTFKLEKWQSQNNANNFTFVDQLTSPSIQNPMFNGMKGIDMNGTTDTFKFDNITSLTGLHAFFVVKTSNLTNDAQLLFENSADLDNRFMLGWINGDLFWSIGHGEHTFIVAISERAETWKVIEVWFDASNHGQMGMRLNNQVVGEYSTNKTQIGSIDGSWLFSQSGVQNFLQGSVLEIALYDKKLTDKEREIVIEYFARRYQLF